MDQTERKGTIQSVDRAIMILRCFDHGEQLGVTDISKRLGLHKSTTFGLVDTLTKNRILEQDPTTGKYRLGLEILRIGRNVRVDMREIGSKHVRQLVAITGETVNLVVRDGIDIVYIDKKDSPHAMRICTSTGQRFPMYCSAVGKAMLAFMSDDEVDSILDHTKMVPLTVNTVTDRDLMKQQLHEIRRMGYATDDEEFEYGLFCVGVPIFDSEGVPAGGLSVSGPKQRMTTEAVEAISDVLMKHAAEISQSLY